MKKSSTIHLIDKLAGSVKIPKKYQGMDIDEMIEKAKTEYFYNKTKKEIAEAKKFEEKQKKREEK